MWHRPSGRLVAVDELRRAADTVKVHAPSGFENDVAEIKRRIGWIIEGFADTRVCGRCGCPFTFDAVRYARQRMPAPRTCLSCRRARRGRPQQQ
jgi:hypothetical protein